PTPDVATCMYYTGIDPITKQELYIARQLRDRKMQRALMQFFKPENWFIVREALLQAGRQQLIGSGCECVSPAQLRQRLSKRGGDVRMTLTTTAPSPIQRKASPLASVGPSRKSRRVTGLAARGLAARTGTRSTRAGTRMGGPSRL